MAVFAIVGKLGTGKTKFAVRQAQEALRAGRRVASNVDLHLPALMPRRGGRYVRVPDKPTAFDLEAIGHGNPESYDEDRNGVLILDELGTWLNARAFQDPARAPMIDWLIHARKHGWDVYLIVQDAGMIDRQVREALLEYVATCMRLDKVRVPGVGWLFEVVGELVCLLPFVGKRLRGLRWGYMPRLHLVTARVGFGAQAVVAERWYYRGDDLHAAYDTRQVFKADYPHGSYTALMPWDWRPPLTLRERLAESVREALKPRRRQLPPKPSAVADLAGLSRDEAWRRAKELAAQ